MQTITLWLLIGMGGGGGWTRQSAISIERFTSAEECQHVARSIRASSQAAAPNVPALACIEAKVYKP